MKSQPDSSLSCRWMGLEQIIRINAPRDISTLGYFLNVVRTNTRMASSPRDISTRGCFLNAVRTNTRMASSPRDISTLWRFVNAARSHAWQAAHVTIRSCGVSSAPERGYYCMQKRSPHSRFLISAGVGPIRIG
jgi:hypothetical protein